VTVLGGCGSSADSFATGGLASKPVMVTRDTPPQG
jgi:hypothetical protein